MHFAWKDDNFLIKILTTIMIFIVVIMIAISPAFASSEITVYDSITEKDITVIFPDTYGTVYDHYFLRANYISDKSKAWYTLILSDSSIYCTFTTSSSCTISLSSGGTGIYKNIHLSGSTLDFSNESFWSIDNGGITSSISESKTFALSSDHIIYENSSSDEIFYSPPVQFQNPSFITADEEVATGNFQTLKIDAAHFDSSLSEDINFGIFDITGREFGLSPITELPNLMVYSTKLNFFSKYLVGEDGDIFYYIPQSDLGIDLSNGKQYYFVLANDEGERFDQSIFTVGGLTAEEELKNKQDETNQKLDEANETNKGIWETIKEVLSYINPFSENFFVYKLIDLLIEAIKSLFIPSDDFFSTYFTNLQNWFSDRLGFLFYPFELIIDILNDILNIDFSEAQFTIADISEPFTGKKLISATTFNFNDLLDNNVWNTVHNIYLILVDAAIVFGLVNLFHKKYEEVTTK